MEGMPQENFIVLQVAGPPSPDGGVRRAACWQGPVLTHTAYVYPHTLLASAADVCMNLCISLYPGRACLVPRAFHTSVMC